MKQDMKLQQTTIMHVDHKHQPQHNNGNNDDDAQHDNENAPNFEQLPGVPDNNPAGEPAKDQHAGVPVEVVQPPPGVPPADQPAEEILPLVQPAPLPNDNNHDEGDPVYGNLVVPDVEAKMTERYGPPRGNRYQLRPRKPQDYGHLHTVLAHTVMTQHSLKRGLTLFGNEGVEAVLKELKQMHG